MNNVSINYGLINHNSQPEYIHSTKDDIRDYLDRLEPTNEKGKFICPVCRSHNLSINIKTGEFSCFDNECDRGEIFKETKKIAGEWVEHPTKQNQATNARKKGNAESQKIKQLQPVAIDKSSLEIARLSRIPNDVVRLEPDNEASNFLLNKADKLGTEIRDLESAFYPYSDTVHFCKYQWIDTEGNSHKTRYWEHYDSETKTYVLGKGQEKLEPYRWQEVLKYGKNQAVFAVEGEKDVETLRSKKLVATNTRCLSQQSEYLASLKENNTTLIIIPDNDNAGKNQAEKLAKLCQEHQVSYIRLNLPELWADCPEKGDITDYLEANPMEISAFIEQLEREIHLAVDARNEALNQPTTTATIEPKAIKLTKLNEAELVKFIEQNFPSLKVNERSMEIELEGKPISLDTFHIQLAKEHQIKASKQNVIDALKYIAMQDSYDPVKVELEAIAANVEPADIDNVLRLVLGDLKPIELTFIKKWLIAAVARVFDPGCEVHTVLTLIGKQGIGKTTLFKILGSGYFDSSLTVKLDKDDLMKLYRAWIQVLDEIDTFITGKNDSAINAFVTANKDTFRVPYDRETTEHHRRSVLAATGNNPQFLKDPNGNRRFWVVNLGDRKVNLDLLTERRDGILSWAIQAYKNGERWWLTEEEEKLNQENNEQYRDTDPWQELIEEFISTKQQYSIREILTECLGFKDKEIKRIDQIRVSNILKLLGCSKKGKRTHKGKQQHLWGK